MEVRESGCRRSATNLVARAWAATIGAWQVFEERTTSIRKVKMTYLGFPAPPIVHHTHSQVAWRVVVSPCRLGCLVAATILVMARLQTASWDFYTNGRRWGLVDADGMVWPVGFGEAVELGVVEAGGVHQADAAS